MKVQHTPNPEAQLPSFVPDLLVHSVEVIHVPLNMPEVEVVPDTDVHSLQKEKRKKK